MSPDEYQELEEIYDDFKNYQKVVDTSLLASFAYLDVTKFSTLMSRIFNWQLANKLPKHQQIEINYAKLLSFLDDGKSIKFNISVNQENEATKQIQEVLKNTINNITRLLDFYCDRLDSKKNLILKKTNKAIPILINWEDLEIKFINDYEIEIYVKGRSKGKFTHKDFGCYNNRRKDKEPDKQWVFLKELSVREGEFDLKGLRIEIKKEKHRQYKMKLAAVLKTAFKLSEDPFFVTKNNKEAENYKVKFKITPVPLLRGGGEVFGLEEADNEIGDFFDEETSNSSN